ncbi:fimbrial protein [Dyella choica]|uniref:Fimbrial protein n=1 Tax=Dyella choica TaxID=1927959 RepID=A0A432M4Z3_9GAMM|nr:fimbrial protein [Dyella choica]RUL74883.1 fimbrial protein [Dyella choica]
MKSASFASRLASQVAVLSLIIALIVPSICAAVATKGASVKKVGSPMRLTALAASANQSPECTPSTSNATITIPSPISIAPGAPNGLIGSAGSVTVTISCVNAFLITPNLYDDFFAWTGNLAALDSTSAPPGGAGIMFQTNVPGIDVLLTAKQTQASSTSTGPNGTSGWQMGKISCQGYTNNYSCTPDPLSVKFTAQLVKTGPVAPGTINSIQLLQIYNSDSVPADPNDPQTYPSPSNSFSTLTLNAVTLNMSTCNVTAGSSNLSVTLPTIVSNALPSSGSVAGRTAFSIQYSCQSANKNWALYMTMSTANPGTATGVIMPSASCSAGAPASNVGIQLLQGNLQPMPFNTAQSVGNPPSSGNFSLNYYAQYYATGSPIGAGFVCGTATFTMSYQ